MVVPAKQPLDHARADLGRPEQRAERDRQREVAPLACRKIMKWTMTLEPIAGEIVENEREKQQEPALTAVSGVTASRGCGAHRACGGSRVLSGGITAICSGSAIPRCKAA